MEQLLEYIRNHILLVVILAVVLVLIIVFLVLLIVRGAQLKKAKKAAAEKAEPAPEPEPAPAPVEKAEPAPAPVEKKEPEPAPEPAPAPAPVEEKPAEAPAEGGEKTEEIMHGDQKIVIIKKEGSAPASKKAAKKPAAKPAEPAAPAKPAAVPAAKPASKKAEGGAGGKWVLYEEDRGGYGFRLVAPNGEVMLRSSSPYASLSSAKSGIKTYQDNIAADRLEVVETKKGNFFVQINNASKRLLAMSADYKTRSSCESAMESIKRWAPTDSIVIETESEDK